MITKRNDGTYVIDLNGMPYHVTHDDPLFAECGRETGTLLEVYCYYADGMSRKVVNSDYAAGNGEVVFMTEPTDAELVAAFGGYDNAKLGTLKTDKLSQIKASLSATDYKAHKYTDGDITAEEYAPIKTYRADLRAAYRAIEAAETVAEVDAIIVPEV